MTTTDRRGAVAAPARFPGYSGQANGAATGRPDGGTAAFALTDGLSSPGKAAQGGNAGMPQGLDETLMAGREKLAEAARAARPSPLHRPVQPVGLAVHLFVERRAAAGAVEPCAQHAVFILCLGFVVDGFCSLVL